MTSRRTSPSSMWPSLFCKRPLSISLMCANRPGELAKVDELILFQFESVIVTHYTIMVSRLGTSPHQLIAIKNNHTVWSV